jgi:hypothetical protein
MVSLQTIIKHFNYNKFITRHGTVTNNNNIFNYNKFITRHGTVTNNNNIFQNVVNHISIYIVTL